MSERTPEITRQDLDDYASGKLDAANAGPVESYLAKNPQIAAQIRQDQVVRERLREMFAPVLSDPVPDRLLNVLKSARRVSRIGKP